MVQWWLLLQNSLQYSDGRVEIVDVPKAFSVGDVVAVTHRRDGGVVVQRVSNKQRNGIEIYLGSFSSGDNIQARFASITDGLDVAGTYTIEFICNGVIESTNTTDISVGNFWNASNETQIFSVPYNGDVTIRILTNINAERWWVIDYLDYYYPTAMRGELLPDGNFESGSFGDGITQWKKLGAKTEIVLNPSYDSSYACKFYG